VGHQVRFGIGDLFNTYDRTQELTKTGSLIVLALWQRCCCDALVYLGIRTPSGALLGHSTLEGYRKAVHLEPENAKNWYLLGRHLRLELEHPDPEGAVRALKRSLSLDPRSARTWLELASVYGDEESLDAAREAFTRQRCVTLGLSRGSVAVTQFSMRSEKCRLHYLKSTQRLRRIRASAPSLFCLTPILSRTFDSILSRDLPHIPSVYWIFSGLVL